MRQQPARFELTFMGFGLLWAANYASFQSTALFPSVWGDIGLLNTFFFTSLVTSAIMHFVFAYWSYRIPSLGEVGPSPLAIAALLSIGYCGVALSMVISTASLPILLISSVIHGLGFAWLDVLWLALYGRLKPDYSRTYIVLSMIFAIVLYFILVKAAALLPYLGFLLNLVLIAGTGVALEGGFRKLRKTGEGLPPRFPKEKMVFLKKDLWQPLVGVAAFSLVYSFLDRVSAADPQHFNEVHALALFGCMLATVCLLIVTRILRRRIELSAVCKAALPLLIVGCLLIPALGGFSAVWSTVLVAVGFVLFDIVIIILIAEYAYEYTLNGIFLDGIVRGVGISFSGIGGIIGLRAISVDMSQVALMVVSMTLIYLLITAAAIILQKRQSGSLDNLILTE